MKRLFILTVAILLFSPTLTTLLGAQSSLAFEVVTIKPGKRVAGMISSPGCHGWDASLGFGGVPVGRCRFPFASLKGLIEFAFGEWDDYFHSITGGQAWMAETPFAIEAKSEDGIKATRDQLLEMTRNFIVQQLHLKFHLETKEAPGFNLVVAKDGPKWTALSDTEPLKPGFSGRGEITIPATDAAGLARSLSTVIGAPVSDGTGRTDRFAINLRWSPQPPERDAIPDADPAGPSLFTVLQEQLGLRLIPRKVSVQVFVIDSAERPVLN